MLVVFGWTVVLGAVLFAVACDIEASAPVIDDVDAGSEDGGAGHE